MVTTVNIRPCATNFLAIPRIAKILPRFVHVCRELSEFWSFIKPKFGTYAERRDYLRHEFDQLLTMLESESRTPSDAAITEMVPDRQLDLHPGGMAQGT